MSADTIQGIIERMVPELEYYRDNKIFSREEIRKIVAKRTNFEYRLRSQAATKQGYLDAIEWERNLNRLRGRKNEALALPKHYLDKVVINRIHGLYRRALHAYHGEVDLWLAYAEFSKHIFAEKAVSWAYGNGLLAHSDKEEVWIRAASWEADHHSNYLSARKLLQRAVEALPLSEKIYLAFFKMELNYLQKLTRRKSMLGLEKSSAKEDEFIKQAVMPKLIAETAVKKLYSSKIIIKFLGLVPDAEGHDNLRTALYAMLERESIPVSVEVCECLAKRALISHNGKGVREKNAMVAWDRSMSRAEDRDLVAVGFMHYLARRIRLHDVESKLRQRLFLKLMSVINMPSSNVEFLVTSVEFLIAMMYYEKAVSKAQEALKIHQEEHRFYPLLATALVKQGRKNEALAIVVSAISKSPSVDAASMLCDLTISVESDNKKIVQFFQHHVTHNQISIPIFAERYWNWIESVDRSCWDEYSGDPLEESFKFLLEFAQFLPRSLYPKLIAYSLDKDDYTKTRLLFEASLNNDPEDQILWTRYIEWSRKCDGEAAAVYLEARRPDQDKKYKK